MQDKKLVFASRVILTVCRDLNYSRAHVAAVFRKHAKQLKARKSKVSRRWSMPLTSEPELKRLVSQTSGRRYKLGERGGHE